MSTIRQPNDTYPKLPLSTRPDEWVRMRPVTMGDIVDGAKHAKRQGEDMVESEVAMCVMVGALVEWSFDDEINLENLLALDARDLDVLLSQLDIDSLIRGASEKKVSAIASTSGPQPARASRARSST